MELQDFVGSLIVLCSSDLGVLFNGAAVWGEDEASLFSFWKMLVAFADWQQRCCGSPGRSSG